jgi:hypothetical protein
MQPAPMVPKVCDSIAEFQRSWNCMGRFASLVARQRSLTMKNNKSLIILVAGIAVTSFSAFSPASAQNNYYTSPAYQAEEQAFRARQNEGAKLHETFGESSPQYASWYGREKGYGPSYGYQNQSFGPYSYGPSFGQTRSYAPVYDYRSNQPYYGNMTQYSNSWQY